MIKLEMRAKGTFPKELLRIFPKERNAKVTRRREDKVLVFSCKGNTENIDTQTSIGLETLLQVGFRTKAEWSNVNELSNQCLTYQMTKELLKI